MSKFSCPFPAALNPLSPNGFQLVIDKLPGITFFCQQCPIPGISLPQSVQGSPFADISLPGDKMDFEQLTVTFLVDEQMDNWKAVFRWMQGLGFPDNNEQYKNYKANPNGKSEVANFYSDARLIILGNNLTPIQTLVFTDIYPSDLGSLAFTNVSNDVEYLTASATFNYSTYDFE